MSLVLGVGATSTATTAEIDLLISTTLAQQGLSLTDVRAVATVDRRREALAPLCASHGWELVTHTADELAQVGVSGSPRVQQAVGTPSVAEAAALLHGELLVGKTAGATATVAVARTR
jgi:cobalt-precorrin 5A hydrolase/precorrin-3B C17-methyltransferase